MLLQVVKDLSSRQKRRCIQLVHDEVAVRVELARVAPGFPLQVLVELRLAHHLVATDGVPVDPEFHRNLLLR